QPRDPLRAGAADRDAAAAAGPRRPAAAPAGAVHPGPTRGAGVSTPAESGPRDPAVRPRPGATRRARGGRWVRPSDLVGLVTALVALALVEPLAGYRIAIALVLSYAIVCAGLVLLVGVAGQLSLGSAIFIAIG